MTIPAANMRRPALDLSDPSRNLEESIGSPSPDTLDPSVDMSMPLSEEAIEATDAGDRELPSTPPPHIAARLFYPPTNQNRRKDSAASSRRNSISSIPSRSSHGHGLDGGPQSKYVAQHLRRASILEDRRARLADRAAHAEKVRLRAATAKAASKDTSASEERAIAAAQARERNLAEIAAACAEEVKRAKAVAESTKEKRLKDIVKMKLQMEERLAEAERRREELRKANMARAKGRERGQSVVARKELKERGKSPMRQDTAVSKIQWWWRSTKRRQAVAEFSGLGLTVESVMATSFEKVADLLAQEKVLLSTARVLRICGLREGEPGSVNEMAAVRSFLSAYLILGHPAQVLSSKEGKGEQEQVGEALAKPLPKDDLANPRSQALVGKAKDLLIAFEQILSRLGPHNSYTPPPSLFESFSEVYATFHNAFIAWKARDSNSLVELMVMQFVELDAILQTVKDSTDGSVDEVYKQSIQENQVLLLVRIKKLAGPAQAKKLISEAVRQSRKSKVKKPTGDTKPRIVEHSADTTMEDASDGRATPTQLQAPTPPATPARNSEPVKIQFQTLPGMKGLLPDNRVVVHELAINKEFRIEPVEYREGQEHLLAPLFHNMRLTLQSGDHDEHFLLLLSAAELIREKLQRLVKPGNQMHAFIAELLDTDTARRQFSAGSFSYEKFFQAMGSLLPKLCAPVRDDEVKVLMETKLSQGNYVDRIEALMGFIDVMLSDYANYLLQLAAPQIIASATTYEAKMFASALEEGGHTLSAATAAWRDARAKVYAETTRRDPEGINHPRSRPTMNRIYNQMLVDTFTDLSPSAQLAQLPEMLMLDTKRVMKMRRTTRQIVTVGAILLQCKNLLKRDVRAPWRQEATRILFVLDKADAQPDTPQESTVSGIMAALETGRSMPAATKAQLRSLVAKFVAAALEPAFQEPVLRLLLNRLRGYILGRVGAASASEKVKAASVAGEKLAGLGLAEFAEKVRDMVDLLGQVGQVDRDAHGAWWDEIAEVCEKEAQAQAQASA
ncbi:hypothetical protein GQ53DRAFT_365902 [Thozetella sp. PMI_491]|nr:hypothetical protein GQ53DRAFT_365902 [Thozetella sp. PMI_491]